VVGSSARPLIVSPVRAIALDPTKDCGVIDGHTAFMHEFCAIAIIQGMGVSFKVAPPNSEGSRMARLRYSKIDIVWRSLYQMTGGSCRRTVKSGATCKNAIPREV
jgi:hypothetical protein